MKNKFFGFHLDFFGFTASFLCALHCAALPLVYAFSALSGTHLFDHEILDWLMIGLAVVFASASLIRSYQQHKKNQPILLVVLGFGLIFFGHFFHANIYFETVIAAIGGLLVAIAHYRNWRYLGQCQLATNRKKCYS